jgi:hypothetical protein
VKRRQKRREALDDAVALWHEVHHTWSRLSPTDPSFHEDVRTLQRNERLAKRILLRYIAIPESATDPCRCGSSEDCRLPTWLDDQCTDLGQSLE